MSYLSQLDIVSINLMDRSLFFLLTNFQPPSRYSVIMKDTFPPLSSPHVDVLVGSAAFILYDYGDCFFLRSSTETACFYSCTYRTTSDFCSCAYPKHTVNNRSRNGNKKTARRQGIIRFSTSYLVYVILITKMAPVSTR